MLISDSKKFIFVHISKTAGTSIRSVLNQYAIEKPGKFYSFLRYFDLPRDYHHYRFRKHDYLDVAERKLPEHIYQDYLKIGFVRNPWDRLVSGYFGYFTLEPGENEKPPMTFMQFLNRQKHRKNYQLKCIVNKNGNIDLDFMGRFENLAQDCQRLSEILGINIQLPHRNKSSNRHTDYRQYYDQESYDFVCENWSKDIELLGYKFE